MYDLHATYPDTAAACRRIVESSLAENTRIAYRYGWRRFADFCAARQVAPLPAAPHTVIEFLLAQAAPARLRTDADGKKLSLRTVELCCHAINHKHAEAGLAAPAGDPRVADVLRGLRRLNGAPPRRVRALREHHIRAMLKACGRAPIGVRDAAIIALGFAGALRRSEICALAIGDVEMVESPAAAKRGRPDGLWIHIRRSKTDQLGRGQKIAVPEGRAIRPIQRVNDWLDVSGLRAAPRTAHLFQSMRRNGALKDRPLHPTDVARIVKHYAARIGLNPRDIAGHSLRAGFVTSAAAHNARLDKIMEVTRHRNPATVLKYIRDSGAFCNHAGKGFL